MLRSRQKAREQAKAKKLFCKQAKTGGRPAELRCCLRLPRCRTILLLEGTPTRPGEEEGPGGIVVARPRWEATASAVERSAA